MTLQEVATLIALILSIYGAAVSSILGWNKIKEYQRNLKIYLEWQAFYEKCHLVIANYGYRPITIRRIIVRSPEDNWAGLESVVDKDKERLPLKLEYGDEGTFVLDDNISTQVFSEAYEMLIYDSEGNEYRPTLKREYSPRYEGMGKFKKMKSIKEWKKKRRY